MAALTSVGALVSEEGGLLNAPAVGTYLDPAAYAYFGDYYRLQIGRQIYRDMMRLDAGLADDRAALAHEEMSGLFADPEEARTFSDAQHAGSMGPALMLAKRLWTCRGSSRCSTSRAARALISSLYAAPTRVSRPRYWTSRP